VSTGITDFTFEELNDPEQLDETDAEDGEENEAQYGILRQRRPQDSQSLFPKPAWTTQRQVRSSPSGAIADSKKTVLGLRQTSSGKSKAEDQLQAANKFGSRRSRQHQRHSTMSDASGIASTSSPLNSGITGESSKSRPEGWWSSTSSTAESSPNASKEHLANIETPKA